MTREPSPQYRPPDGSGYKVNVKVHNELAPRPDLEPQLSVAAMFDVYPDYVQYRRSESIAFCFEACVGPALSRHETSYSSCSSFSR